MRIRAANLNTRARVFTQALALEQEQLSSLKHDDVRSARARLVRLGEAHLDGPAGVLDGGYGGGAGAAVVAADLDHVRVGLGHAAGDRADAGLRDQLDAHLGRRRHLRAARMGFRVLGFQATVPMPACSTSFTLTLAVGATCAPRMGFRVLGSLSAPRLLACRLAMRLQGRTVWRTGASSRCSYCWSSVTACCNVTCRLPGVVAAEVIAHHSVPWRSV